MFLFSFPATKVAGYLAAYWNMPMFSYASTDPILSDKNVFTTLVRTSPPFTKMGNAIIEVSASFQLKYSKKYAHDWNFVVICCNITPPSDHGLTLTPAWVFYYIYYDMWDEMTYPFPNFNGYTVEVWEWISIFIPHFAGHVITYSCWDWS